MSKYTYEYTEQSVDVRRWIITSPEKLTEEQVNEIGMDWGSSTEGESSTVQHEDYPKCEVIFNGTEYGDDTQIEIQGDFKNE